MVTVQLYGKNIANTRIKADTPVAPATTSDSVFMSDGTTLTSKINKLIDELNITKKELETLKKKSSKTSKE